MAVKRSWVGAGVVLNLALAIGDPNVVMTELAMTYRDRAS